MINHVNQKCDCSPFIETENKYTKLLTSSLFIVGIVCYILSFFMDSITIVLVSYFSLGYGVIYNSIKMFLKKDFFNENSLMTIATIGALYIKHYEEAIAVMLFYIVGEYLQDKAVNKSNRSIESILNIMPESANKKIGEDIISVAPDSILVGDTIVVKNGERVPLDGIITKGSTSVDTSSLTGESLPQFLQEGNRVISGSINLGAIIEVKVESLYQNSTINRILDLVKNAAEKKTKTEQYMRRISRVYTPIIFALALIVWLLPPVITGSYNFDIWLYNALILLVIACPCALTLSIPLSFFSSIGRFSRSGILVKGSQYIELISQIKHIVFDKTGTLTKGEFVIDNINLFNNCNKEELFIVLHHVESMSNHPLALAMTKYIKDYFKDNIPPLKGKETFQIEEIQGHGIKAKINDITYYIGNHHLVERFNLKLVEQNLDNLTSVLVFKETTHISTITLKDELKDDSKRTILFLKKENIKTHMLTGDNKKVADLVAQELMLDSVQSALLPNQKIEHLETIMSQGLTAYMGDGINDAPSLKRADIGISMGNMGSSAAVEASDMVIMSDEPSKIINAIKIAKKTRFVLHQNITFALSVKGVFIILGILGMMNMWGTVFADVGVSLLTVLNSLRIFK